MLGGPKAPRLGQLTDSEWAGINRLLTRRCAGPRCGPLRGACRVGWSLEFLKVLVDSGWQPEPAHLPSFDALTRVARDYDRTAWDATIPVGRGEIKGNGPVRSIAISPRGDRIATVIEKDDVKLWLTRDLSLVQALPVLERGKSIETALSFALEGQALLARDDVPQRARAVVWALKSGNRAEFPDNILWGFSP